MAARMRLFIGNLPWTVSSNELKQYFASFGRVSYSHVVFDKSTGFSKGYGFVEFQNKMVFDSVVAQDKHVLDNYKLIIRESNQIRKKEVPESL